jgi:hypothetical protein
MRGADVVENLWWQTVAEAKAKDKIETQCARWLSAQRSDGKPVPNDPVAAGGARAGRGRRREGRLRLRAVDASARALLGLYKLWSRCILFLLGKHWLEWNAQSRRWTPEQNVPKWRMRPVTNLVFAVYRSAIAKLTKQRPAFDVVPPRTGDSEDREAAKLGESLLQQLWRALAMPKLFAKAAGWLLATGNIAIRTYWDAEAGS